MREWKLCLIDVEVWPVRTENKGRFGKTWRRKKENPARGGNCHRTGFGATADGGGDNLF